MKTLRTVLVPLFALGLTFALAGRAAAAGSTYVRYSVDTAMTSTEVDSDAAGRVRAFVKQQGNSEQQRFVLNATGLDAKTPYTLYVEVEEGVMSPVASFTTSGSGKGNISYMQNQRLDGKSSKKPNKKALPESMAPLTDVISVAIVNTNEQVVLTADLHHSPELAYEMAATFDNTGADPEAMGVMAMAVQNGFVQFRLFAAGQSTQFNLSVNDAPVATYPADATGRINVGVFPSGAPQPVRFRTVRVRNAAQAVVLESKMR